MATLLASARRILLQPRRINAYAQAVIRTLQADEYRRDCLMEERVLKGDLGYGSSMPNFENHETHEQHETPGGPPSRQWVASRSRQTKQLAFTACIRPFLAGRRTGKLIGARELSDAARSKLPVPRPRSEGVEILTV